jgi:tRNA1Val (adenine37-N6)-methyltransferase
MLHKDLFHFRQFSMRQAPSGQRVNTDSCAFGALIGPNARPLKILDIGSGTGVLALMLAVRFPEATITAVEPELAIADVARENFLASPWSHRINLEIHRAQDLTPEIHGTFDFVLCNPPYFQNSLLSDNRLRMVARHNTDLCPDELYESMHRMMSEHGSAWVSFPEDSTSLWVDEGVKAGLHRTHHLIVKDHPGARPHMTIVGLSRLKPAEVIEDEIHYRNEHKGRVSDWMRAFRQEWYPEKYNAQFF